MREIRGEREKKGLDMGLMKKEEESKDRLRDRRCLRWRRRRKVRER